MKNVPLKPAEIRYLADIVAQDMLKTSDLDEKHRLAMLAITLKWHLNDGEVQA